MGLCGLARYSTHCGVSWRKNLNGKQSSEERAMGVQPILCLGAALNTQKLSEVIEVPIKVIICKLTFMPNQNSSPAKPTYDHAQISQQQLACFFLLLLFCFVNIYFY